jgi:hypothetical protein
MPIIAATEGCNENSGELVSLNPSRRGQMCSRVCLRVRFAGSVCFGSDWSRFLYGVGDLFQTCRAASLLLLCGPDINTNVEMIS